MGSIAQLNRLSFSKSALVGCVRNMAIVCSEVGIFLDVRLSAKVENASIGYLSTRKVYRSSG